MPKLLVNNREVETDLPLGSSLVDFLRNEMHLYGTKIGCREGDCGACTVLVGSLVEGAMGYRAMASCLTPLGNVVGKHLVTIEGINQPELTVIQEAFVEANGTQCGFCTPGFILSVYGFCLSDKAFTLENVLDSVAGNVCRCTGYASIKRALQVIVDKLQPMDRKNPVQWLVENRFLPEYFLGIPERMKVIALSEEPSMEAPGYVIAGGTDLLIQDFQGAQDAGQVRLLSRRPEYRQIQIQGGWCELGAACTISQVLESRELNEALPGLGEYLNLMASHPIRNMGTIGGNIANASPLGDMCVILMGLGSTLTLSLRGRIRELPLRKFFAGYKQTVLEPGEIITHIGFEMPDGNTRFSFEKSSKRKHLDMATVNSALRITFEGELVRKAILAVGCMGPTVLPLKETSAFLLGRRLDNATFKEANRIAQTEVSPVSRHPGDGDYKRALLRQQILIHFMKFSPHTLTREALA